METAQHISNLMGKRVIILGGSSGLGLATAKAAAEEGAEIVIASSNQARIDEALTELPAGSSGYAVDLSREENTKDFFARIGRFDHLVYTAAENLNLTTIENTDLTKARDFFTLRFWGALAAVKYGAPLINEGGSIGLTSGIASQRPGAGWALAASICGAMEGFCRAMAVELAPIRVNVVLPGVIQTNLWNSMQPQERENFYQSVGSSLLVKRVGHADDIAQTYLFLMKQSFATGQTFIIDGGTVLV
ncbi:MULTISPECIES: SDR family oxidoreductase [unclassified Spirosoma]|uniref:SDR family oxidoreductase n=1 Tax=unclassified Spirosoma TaxID=2621999 RepID=UPI0009612675|nr:MULTISPECIES: SDR family oxidoreductase [unclassified Spirosoma]MBN8826256.1 SDR family oxidoreductase [Spirosoma sp.]OJW75160.1 MAG: short-chain dehydrogenase [Spirosoma sp. 48-14]